MNGSTCGLYDPRFEHDACGIGSVVNIDGRKDHAAVDDALSIVEKLEHRAGKDAAGETGDGVGILIQVPHRLFASLIPSLGDERDYGVGMFFMPQNTLRRARLRKLFETICEKEGLEFIAWRDVPTCPEVLGSRARECMPYICQCFIKRPAEYARGIDFDRRLYVLRREFEQSASDAYIASLSSRTIVYKGMFLVKQLRRFYKDLQSELCESAIAMVHSRFSTNTTPSWERAHPNRFILHNGEINTIRGNIDRMMAREETMYSPLTEKDTDKIYPVVNAAGSDSAMLDNALEFLMFSGIELPKAVMMCIPEPWSKNKDLSRARRDMYHYYATMMEPWDGPAAVLFSDGDLMGAVLDRNGLRPSRYYLTDDKRLILSSEVGVLDIPPEHITKKSRLRPGRMLLVDTVEGRVIEDDELKNRIAASHPYGEWLDRSLVSLSDLPAPNHRQRAHSQQVRDRLYKVFGYTYEEISTDIRLMALNGSEPTKSMGTDIPLAVLSEKHQSLFNYFKQMFAQVTNPPIDSIREEIVTDTMVYIGSDGNLLEDKADNCRVLQIENPILTVQELSKIKALNMPGLRSSTVSLLYYKNTSLSRALDRMFVAVDNAYREGSNIIILSDRGVDANQTAIPSLLAVSALEQYLIKTRKRTAISVILESAEPRTVHHFAVLLGYGARAINPYLAHECIEEMISLNMLDKDPYAAIASYNDAVLHGIVKIAAKMGISALQSYQSAQIFECVGISREVVDKYLTNTITRVGGIGMAEIEEAVIWRHDKAYDPMDLEIDITTDSEGFHKLRSGGKSEDHMYSPQTILYLQKAVQTGSREMFRKYSAFVDKDDVPHTLRGLLAFNVDHVSPVSIDEVEPASEIVKRFKVGAMSYGALSQEAHECLAIAMNSLGSRSNCGEGGEIPERFGTERNSRIKQVASGRFGVTSEYLVSAEEIQIKMAQGAKPGEGGQLPGNKVWPWVAKARHATTGVGLISPPPHHDIYSIEDLAQLIYDLKNANKYARISVKLASEAGVGTIAAGVAKAGAQVILISGYDGGTGSAPGNSIYNAGLPWELGLAETHQALVANGLRSRVRIETDGKLMTGRDVAMACMLGAEEFAFATAPLISMGCKMMRVCSLDTCPYGICTQNPELRKNFKGKPEYVVNFMMFVAEELRNIMACLGLRSVDEMVGRTDLLKIREKQITNRAEMVDLRAILASVPGDRNIFDPENVFDFKLSETLDEKLLMPLLDSKKKVLDCDISSTDRAFGTLFGAELTRRFGNSLPDDSYTVNCKGGAGQSFGAFIPKGFTIKLEGDSNDYLGKGLSGGKIVVFPNRKSRFRADENVIIGNVALYGATSGTVFVSGIAGERFCVRNSGATAVIEGVGDHGCEYMTGGTVAVLGKTGRNFAAGMSGGVAYVLDEEHDLYMRVNKEMVSIETMTNKEDIETLRALITAHAENTGSIKAKELLESFDSSVRNFKKIIPHDYSRMLELIEEAKRQGLSDEEAELSAFARR